MNDRKLGRREFLQAVGATALLAGLSHFRFLNMGTNSALAGPLDVCDQPDPGAVPDYCNPGEDSDTCPDPTTTTTSDVCLPPGELDMCVAPEPDVCDPQDQPSPDICTPDPAEPDACEHPPENTADTCGTAPDDHDICPDGPQGDGDKCQETNPGADRDECIPAVGESDGCTASAEPDFCRDPGSGQVEHDICVVSGPGSPDICFEGGQNVVDTCNPPSDPDLAPNSVTLRSLTGRHAGGAAPVVLGGLAAAAGAVALARRRAGPAS